MAQDFLSTRQYNGTGKRETAHANLLERTGLLCEIHDSKTIPVYSASLIRTNSESGSMSSPFSNSHEVRITRIWLMK